jgi:hypothetical protein
MDPFWQDLMIELSAVAITSLLSEVEMMAWESSLPSRHNGAKVKDTNVYWDRIDLLFERGH